jgi:uncharacterized protein (TIGR02145 family)
LYNGYTPIDTRNIAPVGWHILTKPELQYLQTYTGGYLNAGKALKSIGTTYWHMANGTDEYNFDGRGAGVRLSGILAGSFKETSFFWSSTPYNSLLTWIAQLLDHFDTFGLSFQGKLTGSSIRLCKNDSNFVDHVIGNDGKVYETIQIGNLVLTKVNIAETKMRDESTLPLLASISDWDNATNSGYCYPNNSANNV